MDFIAIFQSLWTVIVLVIFVGIVLWVYNRKHKASFDEVAQSPIDDDDSVTATTKE